MLSGPVQGAGSREENVLEELTINSLGLRWLLGTEGKIFDTRSPLEKPRGAEGHCLLLGPSLQVTSWRSRATPCL